MIDNSPIDKNTILQLSPETRIIPGSDSLRITNGVKTVELSVDTLHVLEAFKAPCSVGDALVHLAKHFGTKEDWMRLVSLITTLVNINFLAASSREPRHDAAQEFISTRLHLLLLSDLTRTHAYLQALRQVVLPSDVVLDIGTGSGILAAGAALAGAKHVYAVESTRMAEVAHQIFEDNGLANRITVIQDRSTRIDLPEKADVLVYEIISNGVFGQDILRVTHDAVQRLLKPKARLIPNRVRLYAMLVEVSESWLSTHRITEQHVDSWRNHYGIDFSALMAAQPVNTLAATRSSTAKEWNYLSDPVLLASIDLPNIDGYTLESSVTATVTHRGALSGVLLFFETDLTSDMMLSTSPILETRANAWTNPVWLFQPTPVNVGERFAIEFQHTPESTQEYNITVSPVDK